MKKLLLLLLCVPLISLSQNFTEPKKIDLIQIEIDEYGHGTNLPIFAPIGWSKDGLFAYQMTYCNGGCGCCTDYISVESAKTDKRIDKINLPSEINEWVGPSWHEGQREIDRVLLKYNILNTGFGDFYRLNFIGDFEIIFKNDIFECDEPDDGWEYSEQNENHYILLLGNDNLGFKKVARGIEDCGSFGLSFEGYFISPFEDRILIVLSSYSLGFEAEEDYDLHFYGCSLDLSTFK
jgi:hypothetical protein